MKTVKNISEQTLTIPNVGVVESGKTIIVPDDFNNANFEVVKVGATSSEAGQANDTEEKTSAPKNKAHLRNNN